MNRITKRTVIGGVITSILITEILATEHFDPHPVEQMWAYPIFGDTITDVTSHSVYIKADAKFRVEPVGTEGRA
jgi:hypothetical protein